MRERHGLQFLGKYYGKPDSNQQDIISALREAGATVIIVSRVPHFVDLVVGYKGRTYLLEVKEEGKNLRPEQKEFFDSWNGGIMAMVRTVQEALKICGMQM